MGPTVTDGDCEPSIRMRELYCDVDWPYFISTFVGEFENITLDSF